MEIDITRIENFRIGRLGYFHEFTGKSMDLIAYTFFYRFKKSKQSKDHGFPVKALEIAVKPSVTIMHARLTKHQLTFLYQIL